MESRRESDPTQAAKVVQRFMRERPASYTGGEAFANIARAKIQMHKLRERARTEAEDTFRERAAELTELRQSCAAALTRAKSASRVGSEAPGESGNRKPGELRRQRSAKSQLE